MGYSNGGPMTRYITLTNGGTALVDDQDYEHLSQFQWRRKKSDGSKGRGKFHAVRDVRLGNGKKLTIRMHRLVSEAKNDQGVFHINGNGLDNRRRNLQPRTYKPWTGRPNESGFHGVNQLSSNTWEAEIEFSGSKHSLGTFNDAATAARAYDEIARRLYGKNAVTNY